MEKDTLERGKKMVEEGMVAKALCSTVSDAFFRTHTLPHVEVEFRLGHRTPRGFDPDMGPSVHATLLKALHAYPGWESVTITKDQVRRLSHGVRVISNGDGVISVQRKTKRVTMDMDTFPGRSVRFAVAQEHPMDRAALEDMDARWHEHGTVVARTRWSFLRKGVRIDITQIRGAGLTTQHQVELEIMHAAAIVEDGHLLPIMHKILDVQRAAGLV